MTSEAHRKSGDTGVLKAKHRKCTNEEGVFNWVRATRESVQMRTDLATQICDLDESSCSGLVWSRD